MLIRELLEPRPKQKHYRAGCLKTATLATVRLVFRSWLNIDVHKAGDINMATFIQHIIDAFQYKAILRRDLKALQIRTGGAE